MGEELVGQTISGDYYLHIFKLVLELRQDKLAMSTLETLEQLLRMGVVSGRAEDLASRVEFDDKTKNLKIIKAPEGPRRNSTDSLIELLAFSLREGLNDKHDRLLTRVLKILQYVLVDNFFAMSSMCAVAAFELGFLAASNAKGAVAKQLAKAVLVLLCELTMQRLKLQAFIFSSPNPLSYFYNLEASRAVAKQAGETLASALDRVVLDTAEGRFVTDFARESIMSLNSLDLRIDPSFEPKAGHPPGPFGWCAVCGASACYYCKEARVPICSHECKLRFLELDEHLRQQLALSRNVEKHELEFNANFMDIFQSLSDKCFSKKHEKDRQFYLDVMYRVFQTTPSISQVLRKDPRFISFVKKELFHNLLRITMSAEDTTLKTCLLIFLILLNKLRKYLRVEIGTFIQEIILEILKTPNSKFVVKFYTLQVLTYIIGDKTFALELFLNFDLRENSFSLCQQIVDLLVKIAVGKYEKTIYAGLISSTDEEELRVEAGNAMINLIKGAASFLEQGSLPEKPAAASGFSEILTKKRLIDEAIYKFNAGKKSGLKMLKELGIVKEGPESLANFLKNDKRVSQSAIGEIFGGDEDFNLKVLEIFLDSLNFRGKSVLDSLKEFLRMFELPGESQKVERILENFAIKYVKDNPEDLNQDAVHLLSFSFMMLHTNIHNPQVLEKMTLATYLSIGKNIKVNDTAIAPELLTQYYNSIVAEPLAVHNLERRRREIQDNLQRSYKEKQELFKVESQRLIENYASRVGQLEDESDYQFVENASVLQIFLKSSWANFHGFFSNSIAKAASVESLRTLVDSTITMIRLCDVFDLETERNSFINILVQFSGLEKTFNKSLDEKNLLFIQSVMSIATKMGNNLHTGWKLVLGCLITINFYQSVADKVRPKGQAAQPASMEEENALFVASHIAPEEVNRIFMETKQLNEQSIRDFLSALCELSLKEIDRGGSRVYYILEQVVVVMHFNIGRNSLEWVRLWEILDEFCNQIMSKIPKTHNYIIEFSVDIVRQLVLCCFGNSSLIAHHYQQKILGVYVTLGQNKAMTPRVIEFVVVSLQSVVNRVSSSLEAGVTPVLRVLGLALAVSDAWLVKRENKARDIAVLVLNIIEQLFKELEIHGKFLAEDWEVLLSLLTALCRHEDVETVYSALQWHEELFNLFWDQGALGNRYSPQVLSLFGALTNEGGRLCFANENAYVQSQLISFHSSDARGAGQILLPSIG